MTSLEDSHAAVLNIQYGLKKETFEEFTGAFIKTFYPDISEEDYDSMLSEFTEIYINEKEVTIQKDNEEITEGNRISIAISSNQLINQVAISGVKY